MAIQSPRIQTVWPRGSQPYETAQGGSSHTQGLCQRDRIRSQRSLPNRPQASERQAQDTQPAPEPPGQRAEGSRLSGLASGR